MIVIIDRLIFDGKGDQHMDKEKVMQELQEKTEEIMGKAEELHKAIEETISQKRQQLQDIHYTELGGQNGQPDAPVKEGYGLVLGGGGGRGSYEIGVWKALEEYRDVIDIKAVSGSSVGALNAALYACGDLDKATQMWYDITNDRILSNKDIDEDNRNKWFESIKEKLTTIDNPVIQSAIECIGLDAVAKGMRIKDGFFSREGLMDILENSNVLDGVSNSGMSCYATCLNVEGKPTPERFQLSGMEPEEIERILLASSAIPVIFPMETIDKTKYYDGGFFLGGDNVPIQPLYDEGYRKFVVVHLDERRTDRYDDAEMIHIFPSIPLGGAIDGMLDFSPEGVEKRINQGYDDAKAVLVERFGLREPIDDRDEHGREYKTENCEVSKLKNSGTGKSMDMDNRSDVENHSYVENHFYVENHSDMRNQTNSEQTTVISGPRLYFTRHGQTVWNVENKICGATDIELTELGHQQAEQLGEIIKSGDYHIDEILYSPLVRASETARHISEITGIPMRAEERLREQCFGKYEGTARNGAIFAKAKTHFLDHYEGGETMVHLCQRVYNLLDELKAESEESGKTYLLVAHNGISRIVQSYFNDMTNEEFAAFGIKNCEVREYRF